MNVVNINGGLSYFNTLSDSEMPNKGKYYINNLKYKLVTPSEFMMALNDEKFLIIDVRPDSLFLGKTSNERGNSFGNIKSVLHIPYNKLKDNLKLLDKNKTILLFDNEGEQSPVAANYLIENGYKTSVLIFGLENIISTYESNNRKFLQTKYQMILPSELLKMSNQNNNTVLIDTRTETEFNNTSANGWNNIGKIKNAVNIPFATLSKEKMENYAGKIIIIYDRMMQAELFAFAKRCKDYGIKNLYLLTGGIAQLKEDIYDHQKIKLKSLLSE